MNSILKQQLSDCAIVASNNSDNFHYRISVIFGITYPQIMDDSGWSPSFEQALNKLKPRD